MSVYVAVERCAANMFIETDQHGESLSSNPLNLL